MPKLIDAEAAKAAIRRLPLGGLARVTVLTALDALPDASEGRQLYLAATMALEHVVELRDAWMSGAIRECDGGGGTRSNRNVGIEVALRKALSVCTPATAAQPQEGE